MEAGWGATQWPAGRVRGSSTIAGVGDCPSEELLAQFVGRELAEARRGVIESHVEGCPRCENTLLHLISVFPGQEDSLPVSAEDRVLPRPGDTVGRYEIQEWVGAGAMGTVFAALDPELKRRVALKVLPAKPGLGGDADRARFVSEAQAMASVRHPNVISVHDVGVHDDFAFFAMELVEGRTLREWLAEQRSVAEVLEVFVGAGRGLAAAHARGLVHRDFKPDNVLVGDDGRVQVIDFGLARFTELFVSVDQVEDVDALSRTQTGALLGTPAYMAPEQLAGLSCDSRSDQFAFCVAVYEGLCGARPYAARSIAELQRTVARSPPPWTRGSTATALGRIPRSVRAAVERGLSRSPAQRFDSVETLVARLEPRSSGARRGLLGLVVGGIGVVAATQLWQTPAGSTCPDSAARLLGVWDAKVHAAFVASVATDDPAARWLASELDTYAEQWVDAHAEACAATVVRGEASRATMERSMACLSRDRNRLETMVQVISEDPSRAVRNAPELVETLPSPRACTELDPETLDVLPEPDATRDAIVSVFDRVRALLAAGDDAQALVALDSERPRVEEFGEPHLDGEYKALRAQALFGLGRREEASGGMAVALQAALTNRDFTLAAEVAASLGCVNSDLGRLEVGTAHVTTAIGLMEAYPEMTIDGRSLTCIGRLAHVRSDYVNAERWLRRAVTLAEQRFGTEHLATARARSALARTVEVQGNATEAAGMQREALASAEAALGAAHPWTAQIRARLVSTLLTLQEFEEAEAQAERAVADWDRALDAPTAVAASAKITLGHAYFMQRKFAKARSAYEQGLAELRETIGPRSPVLFSAEATYAGLLQVIEEEDQAKALYDSLLPRMKQVMGFDHASVLQVELNALRLDQKTGSMAETIAPLRRIVTDCTGSTSIPARRCVTACRMLGLALLEVDRDWEGAEEARVEGERHLARLKPPPADVEASYEKFRAKVEQMRLEAG